MPMRPSWFLVLLAACSTAEKERADFVEQAREEQDWNKRLELLQTAVQTDPIDLDARLMLAEAYLVAFNDPDPARELYLRVGKRSRSKSYRGLGRCALWDGEEEVGRNYLRQALDARADVACAIDLAARVDGRERARILGRPLGGRRWELFRAACGVAELPASVPAEKSYALARARLAHGPDQDRILAAHLADSCADAAAKRAYAQVLLGESLCQRNPFLHNVVKGGD